MLKKRSEQVAIESSGGAPEIHIESGGGISRGFGKCGNQTAGCGERCADGARRQARLLHEPSSRNRTHDGGLAAEFHNERKRSRRANAYSRDANYKLGPIGLASFLRARELATARN